MFTSMSGLQTPWKHGRRHCCPGRSRTTASPTPCSRFPDDGMPGGTTQAMPQQFTSWEAIYKTLRATFPDDRYHMGAAISQVEPQSSQASATSRRKCVIPALCASSGRHTSHWARASSTSISSERHDDPALDEMRKLAGIPVRHADAAMRGVLVNLRGVGCAVQAVGRLG